MTSVINRMNSSVLGFGKKAQASLASVGNPMRGLKTAITGIVAAVSTGVIAKAVTDFASQGDEIAKTARMLGLSAEALQELRYAANLQGVENEQLTQSMKLLNNNLGAMKAKQGGLYSALKLTNPQLAKQLRNVRSTEEGFNLMVDALAKETNTAKRAALAQAAFGKSGQELIKMAEVGTEGLAALRKEAHKYGAVMSDEAAANSEEFSDSMDRVKKSIRGVTMLALGPMIKAIQPLLQRLADWIGANRELISQKVSGVIDAIGRAFQFLAPFLKAAVDLFTWLKPILPFVIGGIVGLTVAQWALNAAMDANPIGAIVLALEAMVVAVVVVIRYWNEITGALRSAWNWFNNLFNNPWIRAALYMIAAPLAIIMSFIQTIVDLLSGKGWKSFLNIAGPLKGIADAMNITQKGGTWAGVSTQPGGSTLAGARGPISPNAGLATASTFSEARSTVDVNFNSLPAGTTLRQRGKAPGVTLNTGFAFAGGAH